MPLARIAQLFDAEPAEFTEALTDIDQALQAKIRQLQRQRRRVAQLTHGERLFLPASVVGILEQLRAMGISERTVQIERDAWILVAALSPKLIPEWAEEKSKALADPGFQRLYLACDQARDWDPDDPRLDQLAAQAANWVTHHRDPAEESQPSTGLSAAVSLITAQITDVSPAWRRLTGIPATSRQPQLVEKGADSEHLTRPPLPPRAEFGEVSVVVLDRGDGLVEGDVEVVVEVAAE